MAITTQDIHAAADRITSEGQQPTLAAVRTALGSGSFTTISEAMKSWRAARQAAAPTQEAAPDAVAEKAATLAAEVWNIAQGIATERLAHKHQTLESTRKEMEQQQKEATDLADQLAEELDNAKAQLEQQAKQLAEAQEQAQQLAAAKAALAEAQKRADGLATFLEQERQEHKETRTALAQAQQEAARLASWKELQEQKAAEASGLKS